MNDTASRVPPADAACPCGHTLAYAECCGRWFAQDERPDDVVTLMRARYTAHVVGEIDFIVATHHPATRNEVDENATARWAAESDWLGLDIRGSEQGGPSDEHGKVEFVARYRDSARRRHTHHERAIFERYHGQWYFRDAEIPDVTQIRRETSKQGRNDPCACGSGKKFKKCCGTAA